MIVEFAYVSSDLNDLKQNGVYSTPTISLVQSPTIKYKDYYNGVSPSPLLDTSISVKYHNKTTQLGYTTYYNFCYFLLRTTPVGKATA